MIVSSNFIDLKALFFVSIFFSFSIFYPPVGLVLIFLGLLLGFKGININPMVIFILYFQCLVLIYFSSNSSEANLLYKESDFVSYYNNYIYFIANGFDFSGFEYSSGFEFALPLLNFFLSILIPSPNPYLLKFIYVFLQFFLLAVLLLKIRDYHSLSVAQLFTLTLAILLFLKLAALQNHFRQGVSSLLLLIAVFSTSKKSWFFYILACAFHLSAIFIYPLVRTIIHYKRYHLEVIFVAVSFAFIIFAPILVNVISYQTPFVGKLAWSMLRFADEDNLVKSIITNLINVLTFSFLWLIASRTNQNEISRSLRIIVVFLLTLGFIPSFGRILAPIFLVLTGYFVWLVFINSKFKSLLKPFLFFMMIILQIRWINSELYYYDMSQPFDFTYVYSRLLDTYPVETINRAALPALDDIIKDEK